jgi:hypothetical protein
MIISAVLTSIRAMKPRSGSQITLVRPFVSCVKQINTRARQARSTNCLAKTTSSRTCLYNTFQYDHTLIVDNYSFADGFPFLLASEDSTAALNDLVRANNKDEPAFTFTRFRPNIVVKGE